MSTEYFILSVWGSKTLILSLQKQAWTKFRYLCTKWCSELSPAGNISLRSRGAAHTATMSYVRLTLWNLRSICPTYFSEVNCSNSRCDGSLSLPYLCFALFTVFVWQYCCSSNILVSVSSKPPVLLGISKHETSAVQQYIWRNVWLKREFTQIKICWVNGLGPSKM